METIGNVHFGVNLDLDRIDEQFKSLKNKISGKEIALKLNLKDLKKQFNKASAGLNVGLHIEKNAVDNLHKKLSADMDKLGPLKIRTEIYIDQDQINSSFKKLEEDLAKKGLKGKINLKQPRKHTHKPTHKPGAKNSHQPLGAKIKKANKCINLCDQTKSILKKENIKIRNTITDSSVILIDIKESIELLTDVCRQVAANTAPDSGIVSIFKFIRSHTIDPMVNGFFRKIDNIFFNLGKQAFVNFQSTMTKFFATITGALVKQKLIGAKDKAVEGTKQVVSNVIPEGASVETKANVANVTDVAIKDLEETLAKVGTNQINNRLEKILKEELPEIKGLGSAQKQTVLNSIPDSVKVVLLAAGMNQFKKPEEGTSVAEVKEKKPIAADTPKSKDRASLDMLRKGVKEVFNYSKLEAYKVLVQTLSENKEIVNQYIKDVGAIVAKAADGSRDAIDKYDKKQRGFIDEKFGSPGSERIAGTAKLATSIEVAIARAPLVKLEGIAKTLERINLDSFLISGAITSLNATVSSGFYDLIQNVDLTNDAIKGLSGFDIIGSFFKNLKSLLFFALRTFAVASIAAVARAKITAMLNSSVSGPDFVEDLRKKKDSKTAGFGRGLSPVEGFSRASKELNPAIYFIRYTLEDIGQTIKNVGIDVYSLLLKPTKDYLNTIYVWAKELPDITKFYRHVGRNAEDSIKQTMSSLSVNKLNSSQAQLVLKEILGDASKNLDDIDSVDKETTSKKIKELEEKRTKLFESSDLSDFEKASKILDKTIENLNKQNEVLKERSLLMSNEDIKPNIKGTIQENLKNIEELNLFKTQDESVKEQIKNLSKTSEDKNNNIDKISILKNERKEIFSKVASTFFKDKVKDPATGESITLKEIDNQIKTLKKEQKTSGDDNNDKIKELEKFRKKSFESSSIEKLIIDIDDKINSLKSDPDTTSITIKELTGLKNTLQKKGIRNNIPDGIAGIKKSDRSLQNEIMKLQDAQDKKVEDAADIKKDLFDKVKSAIAKVQNVDLVLNQETGEFEVYNTTVLLKEVADTLKATQKTTDSILNTNKNVLGTLNGGKVIELPNIESQELDANLPEGGIDDKSLDQISLLLKKLVALLARATNTNLSELAATTSTATTTSSDDSNANTSFSVEGILDFDSPSMQAIQEIAGAELKNFTSESAAIAYKESMTNFVSGFKDFDKKAGQMYAAIEKAVNAKDFAPNKKTLDEILNFMGKLKAQSGIAKGVVYKNKGLARVDKSFANVFKKEDGITHPVDAVIGRGFQGRIGKKIKDLNKILVRKFGVNDVLKKKVNDALAEAGKEVTVGFKKGLDAKKLTQIALSIVDPIKEKVNEALEIKSPSRWAQRVGQFLTQGLAEGIKDGFKYVEESIDALIEKIKNSFENIQITNIRLIPDIDLNVFNAIESGINTIAPSIEQASTIISNSIGGLSDSFNSLSSDPINKLNNAISNFKLPDIKLLSQINKKLVAFSSPFVKASVLIKKAIINISGSFKTLNAKLKADIVGAFTNFQLPKINLVPNINIGIFDSIGQAMESVSSKVSKTADSIDNSITKVNKAFALMNKSAKGVEKNIIKFYKAGEVAVKVLNKIYRSAFAGSSSGISEGINQLTDNTSISDVKPSGNLKQEDIIADDIFKKINSGFKMVKSVVKGAITAIDALATGFFNVGVVAIDTAQAAIKVFKKLYRMAKVASKVLSKIHKAIFPDSIKYALKELRESSETTTEVLNKQEEQAEAIFRRLEGVAQATKAIAKGFVNVGKLVADAIGHFINFSVAVYDAGNAVGKTTRQIVEDVKQAFGQVDTVVSNIKNKITNTFQRGKNNESKMRDQVLNSFGALPAKDNLAGKFFDMLGNKQDITNNRDEFIRMLKEGKIGKEIAAGLLEGVDPKVIKDIANTSALGFMIQMESVLGIKSPSKWAMGVGGYIVEGLNKGIASGQNTLEKAAGQIKETVGNAIDKIPGSTKNLNKAIASDVKDINKTLNTGSMSLLEVIELSHKQASKSFDKIPKSTKKLNKDIAKDVSKINKILTSGGSMSLLDAVALANKKTSKEFNKIPNHTKKLNKNVSKDVSKFYKILNAKGAKSIADAIAKVRKNSQAQFSEIPKNVKGIGQKTIDTISGELQGKSEDINKTASNIGKEAAKGLSNLAEATKETGQGVVTNLSAEIRKNQSKLQVAINQVVDFAYKKLDYMADTGTNAGNGLVDNIKSAIQKNTSSLTRVVYKAKDKVGKGINKISNFTRGLGKDIDAHVKKISKTFNSGQPKSLTEAITRARKKAGEEIEKLPTYTEKVDKAIFNHVASINNTFNKNGSKSLAGAIASVRKNAGKELSELPKSVAGAGTATVEKLQSEIKEANKGITAAISQSRQKDIEELSSIFEATDIKDNSSIENLKSSMESGAVSLSRSAAMARERVNNELSSIHGATETLAGNISEDVSDIDNSVKKSKITVLFDNIKNKLTNGTGEIKGVLGALAGFFVSFSISSFINSQLISLSAMSFETGVAFDQLTDKMNRFLGSTEDADAKISQLRKSSKALGLEQMAVLENYSDLFQTLKYTPLEAFVDPISDSLNRAAKAFSLATEDLKSIYDEIKDITIRGLIDKEAIEGLSRVIPGATQIAAKSLNITEEELRALSSQNLIGTTSFLPAFTRQLDIESIRAIANSTGTVRFEMNKLKNTVQDMTITLGNNFLPLARIVFKTVNAGVMLFSNQLQNLLEIFNINKVVGMFNGLTKAVGLFAALKAIPWLTPLFTGVNKLLLSSVKYLGVFIGNLIKLKGMAIIIGFLKNTLIKTVVIVEAVTFAYQGLRTILGTFNLSDNPLIAEQTVWDDMSKKISKITGEIRKNLKGTEESIKDFSNAPSKYFKPKGFFENRAAEIINVLPFVPKDLPSFASMRKNNYMKGLQEHIADLDEKLKTSEMINQIGQAKKNAGVLAEVKKLDDEILKLTAKRTAARGTDRAQFTKEIEEIREKREALAADFVAFGVGYQELLATIESELQKKKDDPELVDRLENAKSSIGGVLKLVKELESQNGAISYLKQFSNALIKLEFSFESLSKAAERARNNLDLKLLQNQIQDFQSNYFSEAQSSLKRSTGELDILKKEYEESIKTFNDVTIKLQSTPQYEEILRQIKERENEAGRSFDAADIGAMIKEFSDHGDQSFIQILEAEQKLRDKQLDLEQKSKAILEQELNVLSDKERLSLEELDRYRTIQENQNRIKDSVERSQISQLNLQGLDASVIGIRQTAIDKKSLERQLKLNQDIEARLNQEAVNGTLRAQEYTNRIEELKTSRKELEQQLLDAEVQAQNAQQQRFITQTDRSNEQRQADLSIARLKDETKAAIAHANLLKQDLTPAEIEYRKSLTDSSLQISNLQNDIIAKQDLIAQIVNSGFDTEDTRERLRSLNNEVKQQQAELGKLQLETENQNAAALSSKILDDIDRATQRLQHISDIDIAKIELDNLRNYNQDLLDAPNYIAEFNKSMADMQMSVLSVENSLYRAQKALKALEESEVNTPDSRSKMKELRREIETLEIERAKAIEQQQIDSRNAQSQLFSDRLNEIRSLKEFENNISKIKDQINVNNFGLFGEDLINKKDIENQLKLAKTIKQKIEEGFSQGALSTNRYKEEIRQATTALYDMELQLVNVNKQLFNQKLAELRNVSEFEANIKKVKAQLKLASSGVTEDIFQFKTQMLDRDSINSQLEIATRVRNEIEKAFSQGIISVSEYNQEIRQATQQQHDLELQLINIGRQFQTQLEKPIDKINRELEKQKRLLDNTNNVLSEQKAIQEAISNTAIARLNKELEVSDKIKSLMDELSSNTLSLMIRQQEKRLRISQKELKSIEDRFYAEEKSLALTRKREMLENKQEKARVNNDITTQQKLLEIAEKSGNKDAIALYREKVKLAKEELRNLIEQDQVNARINSKRRSLLAINSQSEIQLKQITNQSLVYEQSLERLKYITGDITKQLDKQKNSLQSHKDLTDAIANYKQSLGDIQLQSTNVAKDLIAQLKSEDIQQGLKVELESQLSVLGFNAFDKETDLMIDALKMETKLSKDRVNLLKSQQNIARSMLEIDLQRASIEAKQAVVQSKILAAWSKAMGISDKDTGALIADALENAAIIQQQGDMARSSLKFNQATEMNRLLNDNFLKELATRREIAGREDYVPYSLPRMSDRPEMIRLKSEEIKPPKIDLTGVQQSLDDFKIPLEGMNDKLHNEVQITNSILSNIELAITGQRSIDANRETNKKLKEEVQKTNKILDANRETDNKINLEHLVGIQKTNKILHDTVKQFGRLVPTKDINTDPQIEIKDLPVSEKIYRDIHRENKKTNTLLERMSEMMKNQQANSNNNQKSVNVKEINVVSKDTNADLRDLMSNITMQF